MNDRRYLSGVAPLCRQCGSRLIRRPDELLCTFRRRKYCDARCRSKGPWRYVEPAWGQMGDEDWD